MKYDTFLTSKLPNLIAAVLSNYEYMRRVSSLHTQNYQATSVS